MDEIKLILDKIDEVNRGIKVVNHKIASIQMKTENEVNQKIIAIMEDSLKIFGKLDETLKVENEKEMIKIQITILENEIKELKERIENIA